MISPADVSAVLVTRGDVDLSRILAEIEASGIPETLVWDNGAGTLTRYVYGVTVEEDSPVPDLRTFGRYEAIRSASHGVIYFADDDIVVSADAIRQLIAAYEPGVILANMSPGWVAGRDLHDSVFVGAGAVLDRDIPARAFAKYDQLFERDEIFYLYPEAMVSIPSRIKRIDLCHAPYIEVLEWGYAPNRMVKQPWFEEWMAESIRRGRAVRDHFGGKE